MNKDKRAQEEMVGFGVIVIIVAVIMLFLLVFYLNSPKEENVSSYEINSFIQSFLQYSTMCEDYSGEMSVQEIIYECRDNNLCIDGTNSCEILNSTLKGIAKQSWLIGEEYPVKGYELRVTSTKEELIFLKEGNVTGSYKGGLQVLPPKYGESFNITFKTYY